jgi:hypothetical protein
MNAAMTPRTPATIGCNSAAAAGAATASFDAVEVRVETLFANGFQ